MIKTTGSTSGVEPILARVAFSAGDIIGGDVRVNDLVRLANRTDVVAIQPSTKNRLFLDVSRPEIGALDAGSQFCARGENVIVGILDSGIDWTHLDFQSSPGVTKIERLWDQTLSTDYTKTQIDLALGGGSAIPSSDTEGHGTHVAGIAAGTGLAHAGTSDSRTGIAPASDLMIVKTTMYDNDVTAGIQAIFNEATASDRPAVVNMSFGTHLGAHDGTDLKATALNNLLAGSRGRAIVTAMGNDGDMPIHARVDVSSVISPLVYFATSSGSDGNEYLIDAWLEDGGEFDYYRLYTPLGYIDVMQNTAVSYDLGDYEIIVTAESANALNGDAHFCFLIRYLAEMTSYQQWGFEVMTSLSTQKRLDAWALGVDGWAVFNDPGQADYDSTLSVQSCARDVLAVGSYITKTSTPLGGLSAFSSRGPVRPDSTNAADPVKPDITAPGEYISSAMAGSATHEEHVDKPGTSMAAPHVTGAVALVLQGNPMLDFSGVKSVLRLKARTETIMGALPNTSWGSGKLDALGSVSEAIPTCYNHVGTWGAGYLNAPHGITVGPDRKIYIADAASDSVKRFRLDGTFDGMEWTTAAGVAFQYPTDTAFGPDGFMYVADQMNHRVVRFDPLDPSDAVVVDMGNGGVCATSNVLCSPGGIAVDDNLDLYIAGYVGISKWAWNGSTYQSSSEWEWPTRGTDVVIDRKSATRDLLIYHPFYPSPKILRINSNTGSVNNEYPVQYSYGNLIAMDSNCHLYAMISGSLMRKMDTDCNTVADINVSGYPTYLINWGMDVDPVTGRIFCIGADGTSPRILVFEPCH